MEPNTSVALAVSLDELTFELSGDDSRPQDIILVDSSHNDCRDVDYVQISELPDLVGVDVDMVSKTCISSSEQNIPLDGLHSEHVKEQKPEDVNSENIHISAQQQQQEDFDMDVPPLSLFSHPRETLSYDSDSEFEVPDRPDILPPSKQENLTPQKNDLRTTGIDLISATPMSINGLDLKTAGSDHLQPEILTPLGKVSADLNFLANPLSTSSEKSGNDIVVEMQTKESEMGVQSSISNLSHGQMGETGQEHDLQGLRGVMPSVSSSGQSLPEGRSALLPKHACDVDDGILPEHNKPSIVTTAEDWEGVEVVEPGFAQENDRSAAVPVIESKPLATFSESWTKFEAEDYSCVKGQIITHIERRGFSAFTHLLFGPPKLSKDLLPQRELVFCIAATQLDNEVENHIRVLQTVYRCLTGSKFDGQRFGGHWEEVGFQGRDPATDLRGTGMLALLQLLFFLRDPSSKELARDVYKLSLHPTQNFPFCIMGINLSRICIQLLREDTFNKECNRRRDVISTLNDVYVALFLQFYKVWKRGKTIADSGFVLQDVEQYCRKHSKTIFKDLGEFEKQRKQQGPFGEAPQSEPAFFSVCKEEKCDDKSAAELY